MPLSDGVPLSVMVLLDHAADTPVGKPEAVPIPVAPVVVCVILGDNAVLMHKVGVLEGLPAVFAAVTVIVPCAVSVPQPPVNGIL